MVLHYASKDGALGWCVGDLEVYRCGFGLDAMLLTVPDSTLGCGVRLLHLVLVDAVESNISRDTTSRLLGLWGHCRNRIVGMV